MNWKPILRFFSPASLYDLVQPYKVTSDAQMPLAYQNVPGGRPLHNDWGIMSTNPILVFLQPWQKIPRIDCAYRVPLPFKQIKGASVKQWMVWDACYPLVPGTQTMIRPVEATDGSTVNVLHALVDVAVEGSGWSEFSAWINGAWVPCFSYYSRFFGSKRLAYYRGLKQDLTVTPLPGGAVASDLMCWLPEISISYL